MNNNERIQIEKTAKRWKKTKLGAGLLGIGGLFFTMFGVMAGVPILLAIGLVAMLAEFIVRAVSNAGAWRDNG